jgi:hypothetical protein
MRFRDRSMVLLELVDLAADDSQPDSHALVESGGVAVKPGAWRVQSARRNVV